MDLAANSPTRPLDPAGLIGNDDESTRFTAAPGIGSPAACMYVAAETHCECHRRYSAGGRYRTGWRAGRRRRLAERYSRRSRSAGFSRSERADYLVQLTTARLPGGTGLFAPQDKADEKTWLVPPTRSRSAELRVYTLVISQRETGRELYRLVGQEPVKQGRPGVEGQLLQAFLTQLGGSTATATARP